MSENRNKILYFFGFLLKDCGNDARNCEDIRELENSSIQDLSRQDAPWIRCIEVSMGHKTNSRTASMTDRKEFTPLIGT